MLYIDKNFLEKHFPKIHKIISKNEFYKKMEINYTIGHLNKNDIVLYLQTDTLYNEEIKGLKYNKIGVDSMHKLYIVIDI